MNPLPMRFDPAAEEQAAQWAARLDGGTLSTADRTALEAWLAAAPAHRPLLAQYCQLSADLEDELPVLVLAGALPMPATTPVRRRWVGWVAASAVAAAAMVILALRLTPTRAQVADFATPAGHRQELTLADGSRVELDADTIVHVELARDTRRVRLARGEAFFQVAKEPARPFIVDTPAGSVRVTGTVFDVQAEGAPALAVTVVEGSVQVRSRGAAGALSGPVALAPGDRLVDDGRHVAVTRITAAALEDVQAWRRGKAVFAGTPLREALARFARFQGRGMTATPAAAELRVGGRFSLDDPDGFLAALEEILPVRVLRDLDGSVQVRLRSEP